jgi:hypothetical protein
MNLSTEEMSNDCREPLPEAEVLYLEALARLDEEYPDYVEVDGRLVMLYSDHRICRLEDGGYLFLAKWQEPRPVVRYCGKTYVRLRDRGDYEFVYKKVGSGACGVRDLEIARIEWGDDWS